VADASCEAKEQWANVKVQLEHLEVVAPIAVADTFAEVVVEQAKRQVDPADRIVEPGPEQHAVEPSKHVAAEHVVVAEPAYVAAASTELVVPHSFRSVVLVGH
jgi:hypothetical protein